MAKAVGVDSAALKECMGLAEIDAVLQHDINEAKLLDFKRHRRSMSRVGTWIAWG